MAPATRQQAYVASSVSPAADVSHSRAARAEAVADTASAIVFPARRRRGWVFSRSYPNALGGRRAILWRELY